MAMIPTGVYRIHLTRGISILGVVMLLVLAPGSLLGLAFFPGTTQVGPTPGVSMTSDEVTGWAATDDPARLIAPHAPVIAEPIAATVFMAAYARGDVAVLDQLGSPLYRLEAGRRTVNPLAPFPWAATHGHGDAAAPPPRFLYIDGLVDGAGYTHLLYVATPAGAVESAPFVSVWRVDLGLDGRVIWVEMVRILGHVARLTPVRTTAIDPALLAAAPAPRSLEAVWSRLLPRILLGVEAAEGERYYLLGLDHTDEALAPAIVTHFSVNHAGAVYPGEWTYGGPVFRYVDDEPVVIPMRVPLELVAPLRAYLAMLWN